MRAAVGDTLLKNWTNYHAAHPDTAVEVIDAAAATGVDLYTRAAVHIAAGITAVQLNTSPDDGLDLIRAYAYARHRSTTAVAGDIIGRRLSLRDHHGGTPPPVTASPCDQDKRSHVDATCRARRRSEHQ